MEPLIRELEEVTLKIKGVNDLVNMAHDTVAEGANNFKGYVTGIWLISDIISDCSTKLNSLIEKMFEVEKERTK